ncbi:MAG: DUF3325 domain-containing protein, partial [Cellvibrionaceae bacterium]|nr:DUF3325 domain-containing protein [Cellvibrionaceae bacterium]
LTSFALAMVRHQKQLFKRSRFSPRQNRWFKLGGSLLLLGGASLSVAQQGAGIGLSYWAAYLSLGIIGLAMYFAFAGKQ